MVSFGPWAFPGFLDVGGGFGSTTLDARRCDRPAPARLERDGGDGALEDSGGGGEREVVHEVCFGPWVPWGLVHGFSILVHWEWYDMMKSEGRRNPGGGALSSFSVE